MSNLYYKRVVINSDQRLNESTTSTNNFSVDIKDSFDLQGISHIAVESVSCSNLQYNINSSNNVIRVDNGGLSVSLTMTQGQYDITQFMTALQALLNTLAPTFTVSQDAITKKLLIESTGPQFTFHKASTTMDKVIGLSFGTSVGISSSIVGLVETIIPTNVPNLGGLDAVFFHSRQLAGHSASNATVGTISLLSYMSFFDIPFGGSGTRYVNDIEMSKIRYSQPRNISVIDIKARDVNGNLVELQNSPVQIIIRCYYSIE